MGKVPSGKEIKGGAINYTIHDFPEAFDENDLFLEAGKRAEQEGRPVRVFSEDGKVVVVFESPIPVDPAASQAVRIANIAYILYDRYLPDGIQ